MRSADDVKAHGSDAGNGFYLIPCAVVAGQDASGRGRRLIGAQSALNRVQVWIGDLFIDFAAWRRSREGNRIERGRVGEDGQLVRRR
jgi:hypothetical protein